MRTFGVVGLGYVGLPLAHAAAVAGMRGVGIDSSRSIVSGLSQGRSHVDDIDDAQVRDMLDGGFVFSTDPQAMHECDVIVICVPTPLGTEGGPDLSAVASAGRSVRDHIRPGTLVVLESTTWPGTTDEFLRPLLEECGLRAGHDFHLAYSPERIDPGNRSYGITNTPKVVGGIHASVCH